MRNFLITFLCLWAPYLITAQIFTNQAPEWGVVQYSWDGFLGSGCSTADVNGDGWDDLTFGNTSGAIRVYLNSGGNGFIVNNLGISQEAEAKTIQWVDIDNDTDLDFFYMDVNGRIEVLDNLGNMTFNNITDSTNLPFEETIASGCSWGDYDNDGDLDVYICRYVETDNLMGPQYRNALYRNEGGFTFTNVSAESLTCDYKRLSFQSIWYDWDKDGWLDLYVINDKLNPNTLFHNQQDGTFLDISEETGADIVLDAMTASLGDFNQDGIEDIFCTNTVTGNNGIGSLLLKGTPSGVYEEVSIDHGLNFDRWCWGGLWMDMDNDTDLDLFVAEHDPGIPFQENFLYENLGPNSDFMFIPVGEEVYELDYLNSHSVASGDFNQDGWIDFVVHNTGNHKARIWMNGGFNDSPANYIQIGLEGVSSNYQGVGAYIELIDDGIQQVRTVLLGENFLGQENMYEHFGLGSLEDDGNSTVDMIKITWPSGVIDIWEDLPAQQRIILKEGNSPCNQLNNTDLDICIDYSSELEIATLWANAEIIWEFSPADGSEPSTIISTENLVQVNELGTYTASLFNNSDYLCEGSVDVGILVLPGDFDSNGIITVSDLLDFIIGFGCETDCDGDLDGDGAQTVNDLMVLLNSMGLAC